MSWDVRGRIDMLEVAMGFMVLLALVLVGGAVFAVVMQRRAGAAGVSGMPGVAAPATAPAAVVPDLDARAEARLWVEQLGGSLSTIDVAGDKAAAQALSGAVDKAAEQALADADERYRTAQGQLGAAEYGSAARTALEGLYYLRGAGTLLGLDPGPALPDLGTAQVTARDGRVTVDALTYAVSNRPGGATPYYYPGGEVGGRRVPGGWYSSPWWKAALVAEGVS